MPNAQLQNLGDLGGIRFPKPRQDDLGRTTAGYFSGAGDSNLSLGGCDDCLPLACHGGTLVRKIVGVA